MTEKKVHPMHEFHHANIYYVVMVVSLVLFLFFIVQAIRFHIADELVYAVSFYLMSVLWLVIAKSSHNRGKGHYHYHGHLSK